LLVTAAISPVRTRSRAFALSILACSSPILASTWSLRVP
jgi:hypothetical protein